MNLSVSDYNLYVCYAWYPTFNVEWTLDILRCNNANGRFTNSLFTLCPLNQAWPRCSSCWAYLHICWGITTITISSSHGLTTGTIFRFAAWRWRLSLNIHSPVVTGWPISSAYPKSGKKKKTQKELSAYVYIRMQRLSSKRLFCLKQPLEN